MESPPSSSTWSEAFILSDDSGLLLTSGSISSGSMSGDSSGYPAHLPLEIQDSDCEDKSLSQDDSLDGMSDIMCGEHFNTLKKGPHWNELPLKYSLPIEPPPEFQDEPVISKYIEKFAERLVVRIVNAAVREYTETETKKLKLANLNIYIQKPLHHLLARTFWTSDFMSFSPCHAGRPSSRSSLGSSRLSSSHNSLSVPTTQRVDDSSFITQAVSHDTLSCNQISDLYNVPFDSDVYAVPVDVVKPQLQPRRNQITKRKRRNTSSGCRDWSSRYNKLLSCKKTSIKPERLGVCTDKAKRHSVAATSATEGEPIHMSLQEVRQYLQSFYSSSSDSSDPKEKNGFKSKDQVFVMNNNKYPTDANIVLTSNCMKNVTINRMKTKKTPFFINLKNKKIKDSCDNIGKQQISMVQTEKESEQKKPVKSFSLKQALCSMFRFRRFVSPEHVKIGTKESYSTKYKCGNSLPDDDAHNTLTNRALPPLPAKEVMSDTLEDPILDFATSIHKVKDYGWYWGPLSSEAAEKILSNEPDGSFIVRDSSDDHYIFSLTFKLNKCVRHVRIEHDQGNFSFGSCTKFKSQTIVEFIENAVEHSRSGRYLFFLHRRPIVGPIRVQLLHPVSRFKQIQSLQHMCRFVILKVVRRDLIPSLPLPRRIIDYLSTPHYYSENLIDVEEVEEPSQHVSASLQADQVEEQQNEIPQAGGEIGGDNTADVQNVTNVSENDYLQISFNDTSSSALSLWSEEGRTHFS